ncbi:MAG: hypothetical protein WDN00_01705 [Limisphaerales bacterium]
MTIESLRIGMKVRHPQYGTGLVKSISEAVAEIQFDDGNQRAVAPQPSGLEPAEPQGDSQRPEPAAEAIHRTNAGSHDRQAGDWSSRIRSWNNLVCAGRVENWSCTRQILRCRPKKFRWRSSSTRSSWSATTSASWNKRSTRMKKLSDGEKVEMQQYITRSYGSLTTFNVLFKEKEDQF